MKNVQYPIYAGLLLLSLVCMSCRKKEHLPENEIETVYQYPPLADLNDGLEVSNLQAEGIADGPIRLMVDSIQAGVYGDFHSLLIFRNDRLVFEEYFNGWNPSEVHPIQLRISIVAE